MSASIEGDEGNSGIEGAFSPSQQREDAEIQAFQDARIRAIFEERVKECPELEMTALPLHPKDKPLELSFWEKVKRACEEAERKASEREKSGTLGNDSERQFREFLFPKQKEIDANFAAFGSALDELWQKLKSYGVDTKELSEEKIQELLKGSSKRLATLGEPQKDSLIIAINGMNTSLEEALSHQAYLQSLTDNRAAIDFVYNASYHIAIDLLEIIALNYQGLSPNTASLLYECWQEFAKNHPEDKKIFVPCHSQGAIHVYNALLLCPPELRNRIIVVTIATAKIVPKNMCYMSFNYASKRDVVHYGELLKMPVLDSDDPNFLAELENILAERAELILLEPHPDAIGIDHDFQSPTFKNVLATLLNNYINT